MSGLALFTVGHPGNLGFFDAFCCSVAEQHDQDFELVVLLDALHEASWPIVGPRPRFLPAPSEATPAALRGYALSWLAQRFDAVVFVDSDDELAPTRVEAARVQLGEADGCACALELMDDKGRLLGERFGAVPPGGIDEVLPRANVFGLSNTAYRSSWLCKTPPIPPDLVAVDWFLVTSLWLQGANLRFDDNARMRYRVHPANTSRFRKPFRPVDVRRAAYIASTHHEALARATLPSSTPERSRAVEAAAADVRAFVALMDDDGPLSAYTDALNALDEEASCWWWCVAHPALEEIWRSR